MLRNVRQARHRADRIGGWTVEVESDPLPIWPEFIDLHQGRWSRPGAPGGVLGDAAVLAFHAAALPRLAMAGVARLYALRIGGRLAAAYYTLLQHGRLLFYLSSFDAAFAYVSPGTILLAHIVEHSIAEGLQELDFLRGNESYKYAWGACDRLNAAWQLRPNAVGQCLAGYISPPVALARLAMGGQDVAACVAAARQSHDPRWRELDRLLAAAQGAAAMLRDMGGRHSPLASVGDVASLFDDAVQQSPEISVAAYSLGDPNLLQDATRELVTWLQSAGLLSQTADVVDLGCGIGRVTAALAPHVHTGTRHRCVAEDDRRGVLPASCHQVSGHQRHRFIVPIGRELRSHPGRR